MKSLFVFVFGRPGSGKSELYRIASKLLKKAKIGKEYIKLDDFPKMEKKWQEEFKTKEFKRFRVGDDGGFIVVDEKVYDELLDELNQDLLSLQKKSDSIIFIEFARASYLDALSHFSKSILDNAIGVYLDVSFELCWRRNVARVKELQKKGLDAHFVPRERMEKSYGKDDMDELLKKSPIPIVYIENETRRGFKKLTAGCKRLVEEIKKKLQGELFS